MITRTTRIGSVCGLPLQAVAYHPTHLLPRTYVARSLPNWTGHFMICLSEKFSLYSRKWSFGTTCNENIASLVMLFFRKAWISEYVYNYFTNVKWGSSEIVPNTRFPSYRDRPILQGTSTLLPTSSGSRRLRTVIVHPRHFGSAPPRGTGTTYV